MDEGDREEGGASGGNDLSAIMRRYDNYSEKQLLEMLKKGQLKELLARMEAGILTHQEHAIIAKLLKDNGLVMEEGELGGGGGDKRPAGDKQSFGFRPLPEFDPSDED